MEVISCETSGVIMDELLLDLDEFPVVQHDLKEGTSSGMLVRSELDELVAEKRNSLEFLDIDMAEAEPLANNGEGEDYSSPSEPKWLQQDDEPIGLWVKWRGKWVAGIRCAKADWPLTTLRGKPTHERKKYFVIFFPHTKNYSWADMQLVLPINEFPEPIEYKSHKDGRKLVKNLTAARRYTMRMLAIGMLNIVDQLHSKVVVEIGKDIITWKEFAMEASRSTGYHDLGRMLVKLQSMILQRYMNHLWLQDSFPSWVQRCNEAANAEGIELLKEELDNSIDWNEVKSTSDSPMPLMLLSEWKTWKRDVKKWFSISHSARHGGETTQQKSLFNPPDVQASRKRPKLEIRRAETNTSQMESDILPVSMDTELFGGSRDSVDTSKVMKDESLVDETAMISNLQDNGLDIWDDIVVETGVVRTKETNDLSNSQEQSKELNESFIRKPFGSGNKSQQCIAFIESKGRQCVRWANEGDVYCCVHLASRFTTKSLKPEGSSPASETPMCGGVTVLGTKCKHRSLPGLLFCKKHRPQTGMEKPVNSLANSSANSVKRKLEEIMSSLDTNQCQDIVPYGEKEGHFHGGTSSFTEMLDHCSKDENLCVGSCSENSYVRCDEIATKHTLYCEQHLPNWLKRARNGKSRIISKEVFIDLLRSCSSRDEKLPLHQACDLFYKLFKSVLSLRNSVPMEIQLQWAISEASKDTGVGDFLLKLVSHEKDRLIRIWGFNTDENPCSTTAESPNRLLSIADACDDDKKQELKDEEKWLFRGFACAICLDSFINRKLLESHVEERHHVQFVEKCMLLQCIPCGSHFGDKEQLLLHVQATHPSEYKSLPAVASEIKDLPLKPEAGNSEIHKESTSGLHKFVCKSCGLKFNLLPDLGRHHQAEHMETSLPGSRGPKKGVRFHTYRMKSGRLSRPNKLKKSLGAVSYRIRNRASVNMKRRIEGSKSNSIEGNSGLSTDAHCSVVSNILFSKIQKTKHRPNNLDILSFARSACCRTSLETLLESRFGILPERIYLKAAKLCSEHGIHVQWHQEGYMCVNGCKSFKDLTTLSPLNPRQENGESSKSMEIEERINGEFEVDECHCIMELSQFSKRPLGKLSVLCEDISFGQEQVPIACVLDENVANSEKCWESFTYVTKSVIDSSMELAKENLQLGCGCRGSTCLPTCDHVYLFNNDFEEAKDIFGKSMKYRFPYDHKGRIILEEGYPVYECNKLCGCSRTCQNRVLQNGIRVKLEVFNTENKGWGLRACEHILRGTFVCEYIGEIVNQQEANKRRNKYGKEGCSYICEIDANIDDISRLIEGETEFSIDATSYSNVSRFINHSCSPNLISHQVIVESMESPLAHIGFYANTDIAAGEEITRDYGRVRVIAGREDQSSSCHCRATSCRGCFVC